MIAFAKTPKRNRSTPAWQKAFLEMLPSIRRSADIAFRGVPPEACEDAVAERLRNVLVAYARLVKSGKAARCVAERRWSDLRSFKLPRWPAVATRRRIARDAMSRQSPATAKASGSPASTISIATNNRGVKSSLRTVAPGQPRSLAAGSISKTGSARCLAGSGRSLWH